MQISIRFVEGRHRHEKDDSSEPRLFSGRLHDGKNWTICVEAAMSFVPKLGQPTVYSIRGFVILFVTWVRRRQNVRQEPAHPSHYLIRRLAYPAMEFYCRICICINKYHMCNSSLAGSHKHSNIDVCSDPAHSLSFFFYFVTNGVAQIYKQRPHRFSL